MDEELQSLPDDAELIARVQGGDVEVFGDLYQRYLDPIYRYIRVRVSDDRTAEDLTEVVFLRSFEAIGKYEERGLPFSAFLYQVTRNLLADHYRQHLTEETPLDDADRLATNDPALDEHVIQQENIQALKLALEKLPSDHQEVIHLRVILALPTATVATWMDRSEGAIRVLLHRALKALRQQLVENNG